MLVEGKGKYKGKYKDHRCVRLTLGFDAGQKSLTGACF
jgi:hypothetical protein